MQDEALFLLPSAPAQMLASPSASESTTGRIGELMTEAKLLKLGYEVAVPSVDTGYDLIVNRSISVQVKTSKLQSFHSRKYHYPSYRFHVFSDPVKRFTGADVYIFWGYDDADQSENWWIVPREELLAAGVKQSLSLYTLGRTKGRTAEFTRFVDAWQVFDA